MSSGQNWHWITMKSKGAFEQMCEYAFKNTFAHMVDPTVPLIVWPKQTYYTLECLQDHIRYIDAGVGGIQRECKKGQIIETQDMSIHSVDMRHWKLLKTEQR